MERLGLGPDVCLAANPRLVFARMTGWGQEGPLAQEAGHDINYLALTGALHALGDADRPPPPPLNLVADLGGGALYLTVGILSAVLHARETGQGQTLDVAMVDGVTHLMSAFQAFRQQGVWTDRRTDNIVDGGAPFYRCYETADGKYDRGRRDRTAFLRQPPRLHGARRPKTCPTRTIAARGPRCGNVSRPSSARGPATNGSSAPPDATRVLRPRSPSMKRRSHPHMRARGAYIALRRRDPSCSGAALRPDARDTSARRSASPGRDSREALADWGLRAGNDRRA